MNNVTPKIKKAVIGFIGVGLLATAMLAHAGDIVTYVQTDTLGNPVTKTDSTGAVIWRQSYTPYGQTYLHVDPSGPGFTGHRNDPATGLVYMQARYYDPKIGRFLSVDPVQYAGGGAEHFNLYWYANGNPMRYTDPTGEATCGAQKTLCAPDKKLYAQLRINEGFRGKVQPDHGGGAPTIGYGHVVTKGEDFSKGIKKPAANKLLVKDTKLAAKAVNNDIKGYLGQKKFNALTDFTFNEGAKHFGKSKLLKNIINGKPVTKKNFTDWHTSGGKALPGLMKRRIQEYN